MKRTLLSAFSAVLLALILAFPTTLGFSTSYDGNVDSENCGQWEDVPGTYMDFYTMVCESGIMVGMDEDTFGDDYDLSRAAAAVVGNRLSMGVDEYEDAYGAGSYFLDELEDTFTDTPPNESWNLWILKAMYYAYDNGVMSGDGDTLPTTFRATDEVNTVEFLKILYESAKQSNTLNGDYQKEMDYTGEYWYADLVETLKKADVIYNYDIEDTRFIEFYLYYENDLDGATHHYELSLDQTLDRQDAAALIHTMLMKDFIQL